MKIRCVKVVFLMVLMLCTTAGYAKQSVTVYTAFETDLLAKYKNAFEKKIQILLLNGYVIQLEL